MGSEIGIRDRCISFARLHSRISDNLNFSDYSREKIYAAVKTGFEDCATGKQCTVKGICAVMTNTESCLTDPTGPVRGGGRRRGGKRERREREEEGGGGGGGGGRGEGREKYCQAGRAPRGNCWRGQRATPGGVLLASNFRAPAGVFFVFF